MLVNWINPVVTRQTRKLKQVLGSSLVLLLILSYDMGRVVRLDTKGVVSMVNNLGGQGGPWSASCRGRGGRPGCSRMVG